MYKIFPLQSIGYAYEVAHNVSIYTYSALRVSRNKGDDFLKGRIYDDFLIYTKDGGDVKVEL